MNPFWSNGVATLYETDARDAPLPDGSVHCVVTSPPYWGLRDYGLGEKGIGNEPTLADWVANIVAVSDEVWRVLRDDGTFWLNLGDAYAGSGKGLNADGSHSQGGKQDTNKGSLTAPPPRRRFTDGLGAKQLMGQPWRVAFALQDAGWILRSAIVWTKPNPMPESTKDRPSVAWEMVFMFTKNETYFYDADAVRQPLTEATLLDKRKGIDKLSGASSNRKSPHSKHSSSKRRDKQRGHSRRHAGFNDRWDRMTKAEQTLAGSNLRNHWHIATQPRPNNHFATFPDELPRRCILAGTSEHGVCPTCGGPWTRVIARTASPHDGTTQSAYQRATNAHRLAMARQAARERGEEYQSRHTTIGWRPTCDCYDAYYRSLPKPKRARKRQQRASWDGWWKRARNRPALGSLHRVRATVLDPFVGSGTTVAIAQQLGRCGVGFDLNPDYLHMAADKLKNTNLALPFGVNEP